MNANTQSDPPANVQGDQVTAGIALNFQSGLFIKRFSVQVDLISKARCGGYDGHFETEAYLVVDKLDSDGFVVQNEEFMSNVRSVFASYPIKASCEELAAGVAHIAAQMADERLVSVNVKVFNLTGFTTASWQRGNTIPPFPRAATEEEIAAELALPEQARSSIC